MLKLLYVLVDPAGLLTDFYLSEDIFGKESTGEDPILYAVIRDMVPLDFSLEVFWVTE